MAKMEIPPMNPETLCMIVDAAINGDEDAIDLWSQVKRIVKADRTPTLFEWQDINAFVQKMETSTLRNTPEGLEVALINLADV